jgi:hypothetical protein
MIGTPASVRHHRRMAAGQRAWVYLIVGTLWLSGCVWLCLDQFFTVRGPFGKTPHPWEAPLVLVHGVIAVASMYLLGWISARHVTHSWIRSRRRISGAVLSLFLATLIVSGFALFFVSDDQWQHIAAVIHEISGLGLTPIAIQHWFLRQRHHSSSGEAVTGRC